MATPIGRLIKPTTPKTTKTVAPVTKPVTTKPVPIGRMMPKK